MLMRTNKDMKKAIELLKQGYVITNTSNSYYLGTEQISDKLFHYLELKQII
jgi:hypothetical protein